MELTFQSICLSTTLLEFKEETWRTALLVKILVDKTQAP